MKGCGSVIATKSEKNKNNQDISKLELYRLIGEGHKAMLEGRESPLKAVKEKIRKRREERG